MQDFRKLAVWQRAHYLTLNMYRCTTTFPKDERFGLISQIRRSAASIEANIAEGCGRNGRMDFARFLQQSMGSASELECHLLIARDLQFLTLDVHSDVEAQVVEVKRMLASLLERVRCSASTEN
jgi:four helix bundle protein